MTRGPLEDKIHSMLDAGLPTGPSSMDSAEMVVMLLGHLNKVEMAVEFLAAEIDRLGEATSRSA